MAEEFLPDTEPTMPPVPQNQSQLLKYLLFVFAGLLLLTAGAAGGYWIKSEKPQPKTQNLTPTETPLTTSTPTPDPTANWETYTGESYTVKYPNNYSYQSVDTPASPEYPKILSSVIFQSQDINISFTVADNSLNLTLDNALGQGPNTRYTKDFLIGKNTENIQIDNIMAIKVSNISAGLSGSLSDLIMLRNNKIYQVTLSPSTTESEKMLNQILSTFQFLD